MHSLFLHAQTINSPAVCACGGQVYSYRGGRQPLSSAGPAGGEVYRGCLRAPAGGCSRAGRAGPEKAECDRRQPPPQRPFFIAARRDLPGRCCLPFLPPPPPPPPPPFFTPPWRTPPPPPPPLPVRVGRGTRGQCWAQLGALGRHRWTGVSRQRRGGPSKHRSSASGAHRRQTSWPPCAPRRRQSARGGSRRRRRRSRRRSACAGAWGRQSLGRKEGSRESTGVMAAPGGRAAREESRSGRGRCQTIARHRRSAPHIPQAAASPASSPYLESRLARLTDLARAPGAKRSPGRPLGCPRPPPPPPPPPSSRSSSRSTSSSPAKPCLYIGRERTKQ